MSAIEEVWQSAACNTRRPAELRGEQIICVQITKEKRQITQYVKEDCLENHYNTGQVRQAVLTKRNNGRESKLTSGQPARGDETVTQPNASHS